MSEWDGWDQIDECSSVPILSMSCGEKHPEIESPDLKITPEEGQVLMKRVKSMSIKKSGQAIDSSCATTRSRPSLSKITTRRQDKTEL